MQVAPKAIKSDDFVCKMLQLPSVACSYNFINLSMCSYNFIVAVRISINLELSFFANKYLFGMECDSIYVFDIQNLRFYNKNRGSKKMAEIKDVYGSIYQNLIDAGCDTQTTERCMMYVKEKRCSDILPILAQYRADLLVTVHIGQKQIDCLDFLIYKLEKL